jgi:hypothetical protein
VVCVAVEPRNHQENPMNYMPRTLFAALAIASSAAFAESNATSFGASGDPPRWYEPLVSPRQKYDNAMLEARNALADALRDCRASRDDRAACEREARREYQDEVLQAKDFLASTRQGG